MLGCSSTRNYILIKVLAGLINDEVEWVERTPGFIISTSLVDHRDNHVAIQSLMSWRTTNSIHINKTISWRTTFVLFLEFNGEQKYQSIIARRN